MIYTVNGTEYEIKTEIVHKQSDAFYKALKNKDAYLTFMLWTPPTRISWERVRSRMKMIDLVEKYKEESDYINSLPSDMLKCEIKFNRR